MKWVLLLCVKAVSAQSGTFALEVPVPETFPNASGSMYLEVFENGTTWIELTVEGVTPEANPLTAWLEYGPDRDHSIFTYAMPPVPMAPTTAGFSFGTGPEPNNVNIQGTSGSLGILIDYDVTKPNTGPLVSRRQTNQFDFPAHFNVDQPACPLDTCFRLTEDVQVQSGEGQSLGWAYIREFSDPATGFGDIDPVTGYAKLKTSPRAHFRVVLATHPDGQTHGIHPGFDFLQFGTFDFQSLHDFTMTPEPTFAPTPCPPGCSGRRRNLLFGYASQCPPGC